MAEKVFLVHGWSVRETTTYQALHFQLAKNGFDLKDIFLGRYVSLDDEVTIEDLARALHGALVGTLGETPWRSPFHIVTHSTGALVVKEWIFRHYRGRFSRNRPLKNVVFLAGPHFGSRLAHHGRSMLAHAVLGGDTGKKILAALELGSPFSWADNGAWLDPSTWRARGIRPFCLAGDRVKRDPFKAAIFPAGYEKGSDMVVRVPSANLNFRRYRLDGRIGKLEKSGEIAGVPFAALWRYTHSGSASGIMNSVTRAANPANERWRNLKLLLACLKVKSPADLDGVVKLLASATKETRAKRTAFAQLDLKLVDEDGKPISDYAAALGFLDGGRLKASRTVVHVHKNELAPNHLTLFLDLSRFAPQNTYVMKLSCDSGTELCSYEPNPVVVNIRGVELKEFLVADRTTQVEVVMGRTPSSRLFLLNRGDDPDLHVRWNRLGEIVKDRLPTK